MEEIVAIGTYVDVTVGKWSGIGHGKIIGYDTQPASEELWQEEQFYIIETWDDSEDFDIFRYSRDQFEIAEDQNPVCSWEDVVAYRLEDEGKEEW